MRRGPALRNRLEGEAAIHKRLLDRERLKDPTNGVKYFKSFLRPLFVEGAANVFLYRFQQFMNLHRGNGDMLRWITRFQLSIQRMQEAWNDTYFSIVNVKRDQRRGQSFHHRTSSRRTSNHHSPRGDGKSQRSAQRTAYKNNHCQPRCAHLCLTVRPYTGSATGVDIFDGTSEPRARRLPPRDLLHWSWWQKDLPGDRQRLLNNHEGYWMRKMVQKVFSK